MLPIIFNIIGKIYFLKVAIINEADKKSVLTSKNPPGATKPPVIRPYPPIRLKNALNAITDKSVRAQMIFHNLLTIIASYPEEIFAVFRIKRKKTFHGF